jgi:plastocyanin domain-containing protein
MKKGEENSAYFQKWKKKTEEKTNKEYTERLDRLRKYKPLEFKLWQKIAIFLFLLGVFALLLYWFWVEKGYGL